jgi:hypothetical protein
MPAPSFRIAVFSCFVSRATGKTPLKSDILPINNRRRIVLSYGGKQSLASTYSFFAQIYYFEKNNAQNPAQSGGFGRIAV